MPIELHLGVPSRIGWRNAWHRWPVLLAAIAWGCLSAVTYQDTSSQSNAFLESPLWWEGSGLISLLSVAFFVHGGPKLRWATAFATIGYAFARGFAYAGEGVWGPLAVWMIVASLTLAAYRESVRGDG